jgi:muramoyltetrapeptide carboxypeptidase
MIRSPRLTPGAVVSLVAPAGPLSEGAVDLAIERVRALGWVPDVAPHARGRHGYLSASDGDRLADLQAAIDSTGNSAIWCLRGGYGTLRILPGLDLAGLSRRPRPLIGFSDNTALHLALAPLGIVSFHGPHPAAANLTPYSIERLAALVGSNEPAGRLPFPEGHCGPETLVPGVATGPLVGGNLSLLAATVGTPYQVRSRGAILFMEEVGEPVYRVDRLLSQLLLAGIFDGVAGILAGAFSASPDEGSPDLPTAAEVLHNRLQDLGIPIGFGYPFGHVGDTWTLPVGGTARLDTQAGTLELLEPAVGG